MNQYNIQHRIKTIAELYEPFEFRGFTIKPWSFDAFQGTSGGAWLCEKVEMAETVDDAFRQFMEAFRPLVDRIAFVSQCYTSMEMEPYRVLKLNDNKKRLSFLRYSEEEPVVSLMFLDEEKAALNELEKYEERGDAFRFLREAGMASSTYSRLSMLICALEALAGEDNSVRGQKRTNKNYIRDEILKNIDLYEALYAYGKGVRNTLLHGGKADPKALYTEDGDIAGQVYSAIIQYFNEKHGVEINPSVVHPMRTPLGNYSGWHGWVEPKREGVELDLFSMHQAFSCLSGAEQTDPFADFDTQFDILDPPKAY